MNRRQLITPLGGAATAWPLATRAQQGERMRRIGVLARSAETPEVRARTTAFVQSLEGLGWREDQNIRIDIRWLRLRPPAHSKGNCGFDARKPDVIVSGTSVAIAQVLRTSSVPVLFALCEANRVLNLGIRCILASVIGLEPQIDWLCCSPVARPCRQ
jgi:hypothetical protein